MQWSHNVWQTFINNRKEKERHAMNPPSRDLAKRKRSGRDMFARPIMANSGIADCYFNWIACRCAKKLNSCEIGDCNDGSATSELSVWPAGRALHVMSCLHYAVYRTRRQRLLKVAEEWPKLDDDTRAAYEEEARKENELLPFTVAELDDAAKKRWSKKTIKQIQSLVS
jgi:hypothetical protein